MKLMVLDGNSIVNRAYYGIRPLTCLRKSASAVLVIFRYWSKGMP